MQTQYQRYISTHRIHFVDRQQANVKKYCHHRLNGCKIGRKTQEQGKNKQNIIKCGYVQSCIWLFKMHTNKQKRKRHKQNIFSGLFIRTFKNDCYVIYVIENKF